MTLRIVRAAGLVTVQDLGRPGRMHEALPPGGALVPDLLVAANRAARNPDHAAALEVLGRLVVRAEAPIEVAAMSRLLALAPGDELVVESDPRRVAYLAVRGGVAAPLVLGGRGTHLSAGLGRPLRAGELIDADDVPAVAVVETAVPPAPLAPDDDDEVAALDATAADALRESLAFSGAPPAELISDSPIRVIAGPDRDAFAPDALAVLAASDYRILPTSDRVGTRLDGPRLPVLRQHDVARPMVCGAIEVPTDGLPIVLGPEHPTTGGYPILGVIAHADLGRFFSIPPGGRVRFAIMW